MADCISDSRCLSSSSICSLEAKLCRCFSRICSLEAKLCRFAKVCAPSSSNFASCKTTNPNILQDEGRKDDVWLKIRQEAVSDIKQEPLLLDYYASLILSQDSLESALANHLAIKLSNRKISLSCETLFQIFFWVFTEDQEIRRAIREDLNAARDRDPARISYTHCFLHFKGFQAIQAHRAAHKMWVAGEKAISGTIQSRASEIFAVDIHPGAKIGWGIFLDHATGVVIGETAVVGDNVTMLHGVTLGGRGNDNDGLGDRHPKIGDGVMLGAGSKVLGNIRIGNGATIGSGSVVLKEVPAFCTAVGNPAKLISSRKTTKTVIV